MATAIREPDWLDALIDEKLPAIEAEQAALAQLEQAAELARGGWPAYHTARNPKTGYVAEGIPAYFNRDKEPDDVGYYYCPHHDEERDWLFDSEKRYLLAKGGEGGGKSVVGIIRDLEFLRAGMDGIIISPTLEHFKISLWPEFRRWCPPEVLLEKDRYMLAPGWVPTRPFQLHFRSERGRISIAYCGGADDPEALEGPNVGFGHLDEARRRDKPDALKVIDGRVRIPGPRGKREQFWLTTTPRKHWLFDYFGPVQEQDDGGPDPLEDFKRDSRVLTLLTEDNERAGNLSAGFTKKRGQSLTEAERRVLLKAEWEDLSESSRFLADIGWWDACEDVGLGLPLPTLTFHDPLVAVADAAFAVEGDTFGFGAVGQHPLSPGLLAVRHMTAWQAKEKKLDFDEIEDCIKAFCRDHNVLKFVYDETQMHQMAGRLSKPSQLKDGTWFRGVVCEPFGQNTPRNIADKGLLDLIQQRRVVWSKGMSGGAFGLSGAALLRKHLDNSNRKMTDDRKIRIVKRTSGGKVDCAVVASMGCHAATEVFNVPQTVGLLYAGGVKIRLAG